MTCKWLSTQTVLSPSDEFVAWPTDFSKLWGDMCSQTYGKYPEHWWNISIQLVDLLHTPILRWWFSYRNPHVANLRSSPIRSHVLHVNEAPLTHIAIYSKFIRIHSIQMYFTFIYVHEISWDSIHSIPFKFMKQVRLHKSERENLPVVTNYTGWWFETLWKILVNWDDYSQDMGK